MVRGIRPLRETIFEFIGGTKPFWWWVRVGESSYLCMNLFRKFTSWMTTSRAIRNSDSCLRRFLTAVGKICELYRHREHPERQRTLCPATHSRQPALLGRCDARRRVSLRSGIDPLAGRIRAPAGEPAYPLGHRSFNIPRSNSQGQRSGTDRPTCQCLAP